MSMLCLSTELSSQEMASWVQAIGSILAIGVALGVAIWQGNKQFKNAISLHRLERKHEKIELAKTLSSLANNTSKMMALFAEKLKDRETVYNIAEGHTSLDFGELNRLDNAIAGIPLHELPDSLITPTMIFSSTVRQFREKIEQVLRVHRKMNSEEFNDFFKCLHEMNESFDLTRDDVSRILEEMESSAN